MKALALAMLLAAPDGGLDVELLDAGSVLPTQMACMPPESAQTLDLGLRDAESERDSLRVWIVIAPIAAFVVGAVAAGAVVSAVKR